jgi:hypothetical protein
VKARLGFAVPRGRWFDEVCFSRLALGKFVLNYNVEIAATSQTHNKQDDKR